MIDLTWLVGNDVLSWLTEVGVEGWYVLFILLTFGLLHWFLVSNNCTFRLIKGDNGGYYVISPDRNRTDETILIIALAQWVFYNSLVYVMGIIAGIAFILYARIYPSL